MGCWVGGTFSDSPVFRLAYSQQYLVVGLVGLEVLGLPSMVTVSRVSALVSIRVSVQ